MNRKPIKYDPEFIRTAVELSNVRPSIVELARELNIRPELLYRWRTLAGAQERSEGTKKSTLAKPQDEAVLENKRLRKELEQVSMERDILKKALGIFSKTDGTTIR